MTRTLRIGTRGSALARLQAMSVATALMPFLGPIEIVVLQTDGDVRPTDSPSAEGAFVSLIEVALRSGAIDLAIHSAKDLPTDREADPDLVVAGYLPRADPRDVVVTHTGRGTLATFPSGTTIGTDSPRRAGFVLAARPDLRVRSLVGNVDTRLRRLDAGEVDALVLAAAGLIRLGFDDRIDEALDPAIVPPAAGQGALAIQVRRGDPDLVSAVQRVDDRDTRTAVEIERAVLDAVGGGCRTPVGVLATLNDDCLSIIAARVEPDGTRRRAIAESGPSSDRQRLARAVAAELVR